MSDETVKHPLIQQADDDIAKLDRLITTARGYTRTIKPRLINWRCEWCEKDHSEYRYPGAKPRYCDECRQPAQNAIAARQMRQRRHHICPTCTRPMVQDSKDQPWYCWHCSPK